MAVARELGDASATGGTSDPTNPTRMVAMTNRTPNARMPPMNRQPADVERARP